MFQKRKRKICKLDRSIMIDSSHVFARALSFDRSRSRVSPKLTQRKSYANDIL